jgi:hypothetical protein
VLYSGICVLSTAFIQLSMCRLIISNLCSRYMLLFCQLKIQIFYALLVDLTVILERAGTKRLENNYVSRRTSVLRQNLSYHRIPINNETQITLRFMKLHVNFTCRRWVFIDNPSVPLNATWVHVNANHRQAQYCLRTYDGLTSASIMTAVKTPVPMLVVFRLITIPTQHNTLLYFTEMSQHF